MKATYGRHTCRERCSLAVLRPEQSGVESGALGSPAPSLCGERAPRHDRVAGRGGWTVWAKGASVLAALRLLHAWPRTD